MSKVNKDTLLEQRGKVMRYWDFVKSKSLTEKTHWNLNPDNVRVEPDIECVEKCWEIIRSEATNYYDMVKFLSPSGEIKVGLQQVIEHIMDIVDEHLNQGIKVKDDHVMIFNLEQFVKKTTELDYAMTVEMLVRRLVGINGEQNYRKIIRQIIENETDVNHEANLEIIELAQEDEEAEKVEEQ